MARPKANQLTERELEIMQVFWDDGELTAAQVREQLASTGRDLAYPTVATLIKILVDKEFIQQTTDKRPFQYQPTRTFDEVSGNLLTEMIKKVFGGSREQLLVRLMDQKKLSKRERELLETVLKEQRK
jgi:predicted transcriptional regulator